MHLKAFEQETIPGVVTLPLTYLIAYESNQPPTETKQINEMRNEALVAISYNVNKLRLNHPRW